MKNKKDVDICPRCNKREIEIDDYGVVLCFDCYNRDKHAQNTIENSYKDDCVLFGWTA